VQRLIVLVAALALAAATARLGVWQLDRAAQKVALQAAIGQRGAAPPLRTGDLARDPSAAEAQHHRRIAVEGTWQQESTVFLDNRQMNGHPGFVVVTPLVLDDGTAVLVQRGWLPRDPRERTRVAAPPLAPGRVRVEGRIAPPPTRLLELGAEESGPIRQNLDLESFGRETRQRLRPLSVVQTAPVDATADGLQRDWPAPAVDVSRHHGYAFQWFALSALTIGLYVWFQLVRPRLRPRRPDA
jgi:surfeit locus 1 family protein